MKVVAFCQRGCFMMKYFSKIVLLMVVPLLYIGTSHAALSGDVARGEARGGARHMEEHNFDRRGVDERRHDQHQYHPEARAYEHGVEAGSSVEGANSQVPVEVIPEYPSSPYPPPP